MKVRVDMKTSVKGLLYRFFYRLRKPEIGVYEARLSGDGNLIDVRYWFSRPDQLSPDCNIFLTHEETGEAIHILRIPKFGAIKTMHAKSQYTGNLLLYNRNGLVKPGSNVTLHFDSISVSGIVVK